MSRPEPAAVSLKDLSISFGETQALRNVTVEIPSRRLTGIVGPSGCGKTTLMKVLGCELPCDADCVWIQNVPARLWPEKKRSACWLACPRSDRTACAEDLPRLADIDVELDSVHLGRALRLLGSEHLAHRTSSSLSSREMARMDLAWTLAESMANGRTALGVHLWLDDPLDGLDSFHQHRLMQWLNESAPDRQTTVVTLTDHALARSYVDHAVLLRDGILIASGPGQTVLTPSRLTRAYAEVPW